MKKFVDFSRLDSIFPYEEAYRSIIPGKIERIGKDQLVSCCPLPDHEDSNPSFSFNTETGQCHCFGCGFTGNFFTVYAERNGLPTRGAGFVDAVRRACQDYGVTCPETEEQPTAFTQSKPQKPKAKRQPPKPKAPAEPPSALPYTLAEYAAEKHLPEQWLRDECFAGEGTISRDFGQYLSGDGFVTFQYLNGSGEVIREKRRYSPLTKNQNRCRFSWSGKGAVSLYGLWRDVSAQEVFVCEGESDAQTLWYLGFNALGVPGAEALKPEYIGEITKYSRVIIHQDNDEAGERFGSHVKDALTEAGYTGDVITIKAADADPKCKDLSDLYIKLGKEAAQRTIDALLSSEPQKADETVRLEVPAPYTSDDSGVWRYDKQGASLVIRTPITITRRLVSYDTAEEKIEVAFKRDGKMIKGIFPRQTIFSKTGVMELTAKGATVSTDNAGAVVRFLSELESANIDRIPVQNSVSTLGWIPGKRAFYPWHSEDIVLDSHSSLSGWANACVKKGTLSEWAETMRTVRENSFRFRFILAGSFTAPLLKILGCRSFLIYNWADSRGGKTASVKAALSVWGDPERMMVTFNSTKVALERMASFFCDLPLGIDERQLAGSSQESLETIFYMLSNGVSRGRGTRDGGIQEMSTWRTVALTTGEEPVQQGNTMSGVASRTIELVGAPFASEREAAAMHRSAGLNTGVAGDTFLQYILSQTDQALFERYSAMMDAIERVAGDRNASHIQSLSAVATADSIVSEIIFGEDPQTAANKAFAMVQEVLAGMRANELPDVNVNAAAFILDWLNSNKDKGFSADASVRVGWVTTRGARELFEVVPTAIKDALKQQGFSERKTFRFLADNGVLELPKTGRNLSVKIRKNGTPVRLYVIDVEKLNSIVGTENDSQDVIEDEMPF